MKLIELHSFSNINEFLILFEEYISWKDFQGGKMLLKKVIPHIVASNMHPSFKLFSLITNNAVSSKDFERYTKELTKNNRTWLQLLPHTTTPEIHKLVLVGLMLWFNRNLVSPKDLYKEDSFGFNAVLEITGDTPFAVMDKFRAHKDEIKQTIDADSVLRRYSVTVSKWVDFSKEQKEEMVEQAVLALSNRKIGSVSAAQIANFLITKYRLLDNPDSLSRRVDEILSQDNMIRLDKYRVRGKDNRG